MPLTTRRRPCRPTTPADLPDGLAVAIGTSGSTGRPKRALLTADALERSAWATHQVLGGSGAWLLAMPAHHVAGLQVLLRSIAAGVAPAVLDLRDGFSVAGVRCGGGRVAPDERCARAATRRSCRPSWPGSSTTLGGLEALRGFDGVLVGGAATPPALVERARAARRRPQPHLRHERDGRRLRLRRRRRCPSAGSTSTTTGTSCSAATPSPTATSASRA